MSKRTKGYKKRTTKSGLLVSNLSEIKVFSEKIYVSKSNEFEFNIKTEEEKSHLKDQIAILLYYFLSTWFTLSLIRFFIFLPKLLKSSSGEIYSQSIEDYQNHIYDPNEKQNALVFSEYGLLSWYLLPSLFFILLSIWIFSTSNKYLQKSWTAVFTTTIFVVLGICTSIFSIWRA